MPDVPFEEQQWARHIRRLSDRQHAIDLLEARRDFLRLQRREDAAIRQVYIDAADSVAKQIRGLSSRTGELTRNHLAALERALRDEAEAIHQAVSARTRQGMEQAAMLGGRPIENQLLRAVRQANVQAIDVTKLQRGFAQVNRAAVEALWARTHKGLRVSDRIWRSANNARQTMQALIAAGIASGRDAVDIARDLEQYVRKGSGTLAGDYKNMMARMHAGTPEWVMKAGFQRIPKDISYEALRIARTEKTRAYHEGTYSRGRMNPSYLGVRWVLSDAHAIPDICDDLAEQDLYDMGPGVYPKGEEPTTPHPNCYDDQTEVYTDRGWVMFKDLHGEEKILSMNPHTSELEWTTYVASVSYQYDGDMVRFHSRNFDLLVTPNHRMIVGFGKRKRWEIVSADELARGSSSKFRIPRSGKWLGEDPRTIRFGGLDFEAETFCRFMAYYLSDGSTTKRSGSRYQIAISKTGTGREQIITDLARMPVEVCVGQQLYIFHRALGERLYELGKSFEKRIPDEIKALSPRLIRIFLDAYKDCDGHERASSWEDKGLQSTERTYFTTSERMAADLGELIVKSGHYPSYYLQKSAGKEVEFPNGRYRMNHDVWVIRENRSQCAWYHPGEEKGLRIDRVPYSGMVYDIELARNHVLWVRRNGKTTWSGNCMCQVLPHLEDTGKFVERLIEWQNDQSAHPDIEKWYNEVYRGEIEPSAALVSDASSQYTALVQGAPIDDRVALSRHLLDQAGLQHVPVSVVRMRERGATGFNIASDEIAVRSVRLQHGDTRPLRYQIKTAFHEYVHARFDGLGTDRGTQLTLSQWTRIEEAVAETTAHFLTRQAGVTGEIMPAYSDYLVDVLPRLKRLPEFQAATSIEDFGSLLAEYRLGSRATARWRSLHDRIAAVPHDIGAYAQAYRKYVEEHLESIVRLIAENVGDQSPQMFDTIRATVERDWTTGNNTGVGFNDSLLVAMVQQGVN